MPENENVMELADFERTLEEDKAAEEAAKVAAAAAKEKPASTATDLPSALQGKSAEEIAELAASGIELLRKSEQARMQLVDQLAAAAAHSSERQVEEPDPELTDEQIQRLHEEDPVKAIKKVAEITEKRVTKRLHEERVAPLMSQIGSLAATQEILAKDRHKALFTKYGDEIAAEAKKMRPEALAHPGVWDDLATYVTGRHYRELMDEEIKRRAGEKKDEEKERAGHSAAPSPKSRTEEGAQPLDALSREVMEKLGVFKDEADYRKWSGGRKMEITEVPQ